jgi:NAD(P)-dependent dehydrogenase (short-subunit alcohol dehydrogenase family)
MAQVMGITGGSRGIGAAVALAAARRGDAVAVGYQSNRVRAEAVVEEIVRRSGTAIAVAVDVARQPAVEEMFAAVDRALGPPTALVATAGIIGPTGRVEDYAEDALARLFAVNVTGTLLCCRAAIRRMSTKHGGRGGAIVTVSSTAARLGGGGGTVAYAASKGAIDTLTFGLAQELATEGIRVNAVRPGVIDTEIHPPGRLAGMLPLLPMKRAGRAEEVAQAILWLLSDEAAYVSGAILDVSGAR